MDAKAPGISESVTYQAGSSAWRRVWRGTRILVLIVAALAGLAALGDWIHDRLTHVYIDDARITADVVSVSSRVSRYSCRHD